MSGAHNPLVPVASDLAWSAAATLVIALAIVALISLARAAKRLTTTDTLIWVVIVLLVPGIGPLAWLTVGRRALAVGQAADRAN